MDSLDGRTVQEGGRRREAPSTPWPGPGEVANRRYSPAAGNKIHPQFDYTLQDILSAQALLL